MQLSPNCMDNLKPNNLLTSETMEKISQEQQTRNAQQEWSTVQTIQIQSCTEPSERSHASTEPLYKSNVCADELEEYFELVDLRPQLINMSPPKPPDRIRRLYIRFTPCMRPEPLVPNLQTACRRFFALAQTQYSELDGVHFRMLATIYRKLLGCDEDFLTIPPSRQRMSSGYLGGFAGIELSDWNNRADSFACSSGRFESAFASLSSNALNCLDNQEDSGQASKTKNSRNNSFRNHVENPVHRSIGERGWIPTLEETQSNEPHELGLLTCSPTLVQRRSISWQIHSESNVSAALSRETSFQQTRAVCPARYGDHWTQIGFQGNDPASDLRCMGILALVQLTFLVIDQRCAWVAVRAFHLSRSPVQQFPLCALGVNFTLICVQLLRSGELNAYCNKQASLYEPINLLYSALWMQFVKVWIQRRCTIVDTADILQELRIYAKKKPVKLIKRLLKGESYLENELSSLSKSRCPFIRIKRQKNIIFSDITTPSE